MSDFSVTMTEDRLKVILDCDLSADGDLSALVSGIVAELNRLGLGNQVDPRGLEEWLRRKLHGKSRVENEILIEGQPPEYGQDGKIEWLRDFFTEGFEVDPDTGAIDYRRPKSHRAVEAGQALARYIPPIPSRPGKDVFGKVIEVPKPVDPGIRAGQNVEYRTEEDTFYSTATGRVE